MKQSLGLIEVRGLALAVNVADAMAKSAAIQLVGVEKTNGGGWTVIKIIGDVAAVKSALNTGAALAEQFAGLISQTALSRPDDHVMRMTVPSACPPAVVPVIPDAALLSATLETPPPPAPPSANTEHAETTAPDMSGEPPADDVEDDIDSPDDADDSAETGPTADQPAASCNLCHDPLCPRQKGEPRHKCLHFRG